MDVTRVMLIRFAAVCLPMAVAVSLAFAQSDRGSPRRDGAPRAVARSLVESADDDRDQTTDVSAELFFDARFGAGLHAQQWSQEFQRLGFPVRIRRGLPGDEPEIKETTLGPRRRVTVVGQLDRSGDVLFPERRFSRNQAGRLGDWLKELQTYGAQGAPAGQPVWGLDKAQFEALYSAMSRKVEADVEGLSLKEAAARLGLPETYRLRFTARAERWLASEYPGEPKFPQSLKGFSSGTALAILVGDYGLGVRPQRQPDGSIDLVVDPLRETTDVWPVGWEPKDSRQKTFPTLYELLPVELEDARLTDVLHAVSVKTGVPVRFDHYRIQASGIKLDEIVVNYPPRRTSWSLLLRGVTNPHRLTRELKIDERGQPFIWITTLKLGRLGRPENEE